MAIISPGAVRIRGMSVRAWGVSARCWISVGTAGTSEMIAMIGRNAVRAMTMPFGTPAFLGVTMGGLAVFKTFSSSCLDTVSSAAQEQQFQF